MNLTLDRKWKDLVEHPLEALKARLHIIFRMAIGGKYSFVRAASAAWGARKIAEMASDRGVEGPRWASWMQAQWGRCSKPVVS